MNHKLISEYCTGCGACAFKCPKHAISFVINSNKEYIASINTNMCINCGKCAKICPQLNSAKLNRPFKTYVAWTKNKDDYDTTSSGGLGTLFTKEIIDNYGIAYGAAFQNKGLVHHIRVNSIEGIEKLKGSKYIQSDFRNVFYSIEQDIADSKEIIVIGVPCQIAAIRNVFSVNQLKKVFLVDLVCHGTPPEAYFCDYLKSILIRQNINIADDEKIEVAFRKKSYKLSIKNDNNYIYCKRYEIDPYYRSFMYGLIFRENCYTCKYSQSNRVGDMTICDYWGLDRTTTAITVPEFVSCVLLNTEKGHLLFDRIKHKCNFEERELSEAVKGNANLQHSSERHSDRNVFLKKIADGCDFIDSVNETSIHNDIIKCKIADVIKAPYRKIKYGNWNVK